MTVVPGVVYIWNPSTLAWVAPARDPQNTVATGYGESPYGTSAYGDPL